MTDYISREAAIKAVKKERGYKGKFSFEEEHAWAVGFQQGISFALSDVAAIPAADVRPVVKAFWIDIWSESDPNTSPSAKCSNCYMTSERPVGFFCKWCGADMREES